MLFTTWMSEGERAAGELTQKGKETDFQSPGPRVSRISRCYSLWLRRDQKLGHRSNSRKWFKGGWEETPKSDPRTLAQQFHIFSLDEGWWDNVSRFIAELRQFSAVVYYFLQTNMGNVIEKNVFWLCEIKRKSHNLGTWLKERDLPLGLWISKNS